MKYSESGNSPPDLKTLPEERLLCRILAPTLCLRYSLNAFSSPTSHPHQLPAWHSRPSCSITLLQSNLTLPSHTALSSSHFAFIFSLHPSCSITWIKSIIKSLPFSILVFNSSLISPGPAASASAALPSATATRRRAHCRSCWISGRAETKAEGGAVVIA